MQILDAVVATHPRELRHGSTRLKTPCAADDASRWMDEFSTLAHRIAGGDADVRGCLILSREGMIVGSFPDDESVARPAWVRFAALGDPDRSFVQFPDQLWVYVHRGPYAAFVLAGSSVRPGLLMDRLDQALLIAEEARTRRETLRVPDTLAAPSGKPRATLHPATESLRADAPVMKEAESEARSEARAWSRGRLLDPVEGGPGGQPPDPSRSSAEKTPARTEDGEQPARHSSELEPGSDHGPDPEPPEQPEPTDSAAPRQASFELDEDAEVDRVLLAKEFSGLLQVDGGDDEAKS